jgi:hypothetical protein
MDEVWVLSWRYGDGSASGVLRAYADEDRAREDMDLLDDCKEYELTCLPIYKSAD